MGKLLGFVANIKGLLIFSAVIAAVSFTSGYKLKSLFVDAAHAKELQAEIDAKMAWIEWGDQQIAALQKKLKRRNVTNTIQKVSNETNSNDIYRSLLPDSGVRLYEEVRQGKAAGSTDGESRSTGPIKIGRDDR